MLIEGEATIKRMKSGKTHQYLVVLKSVWTGRIPDDWRTVVIMFLIKNGAHKNVDNYWGDWGMEQRINTLRMESRHYLPNILYNKGELLSTASVIISYL